MVCTQLGIRQTFTTTYHPQTNGQVERLNSTILASIRAFLADNTRDWSELVPMLTYAHNTQVHSSLGVAPFQLVLSRPTGSVVIKKEPVLDEGGRTPREFLKRFMSAVKKLSEGAVVKLNKSQKRYKRDFHPRIRPLMHAKQVD